MTKARWAWDILLPMFAGGMIYILLRSRSLLMFYWFDAAGTGLLVDAVRGWCTPLRAGLPTWLVFSLPTALYFFSLVNYCRYAGSGPDAIRLTAWACAAVCSAELVQHWIPALGTYSSTDLGLNALAVVLSRPGREALTGGVRFARSN